jgi:hypothetical protein
MYLPKRLNRLAMVGVAGAAAVTMVAGCGSSGGSGGGATINGSPNVLVAASVDKAVAAKNSKLSMDFKVDAAGQNVSFGGDGIADYAGKKFQLNLKLPSSLGVEGSIQERLIGSSIYIKFPSEVASKLGGKSWFKIDASELKGSSSGGGAFGQDPTEFLTTLKSVSSSVENLGTADVRGVKTTHYRAQVDLTKASAASGTDSSQLDQYKELIGSETLPEDVYLDSDGLPRRVSVTIKPEAGSEAAKQLNFVSVSVDFYDFGKADTGSIVAPPSDEVGELPTSVLNGISG